jgi:hypothetical protein
MHRALNRSARAESPGKTQERIAPSQECLGGVISLYTIRDGDRIIVLREPNRLRVVQNNLLALALAGDGLHGYPILKEMKLRTGEKVQAEHKNALWKHQALACRST